MNEFQIKTIFKSPTAEQVIKIRQIKALVTREFENADMSAVPLIIEGTAICTAGIDVCLYHLFGVMGDIEIVMAVYEAAKDDVFNFLHLTILLSLGGFVA